MPAVCHLNLVYNSHCMQPIRNNIQRIVLRSALIIAIVSILVSCQLTPTPAQPSPPTVEATLPHLPETFQTTFLNPLDVPRDYVEETCRYLKNKWNPLSAEPGTIVMPILIENIVPGTADLPGSVNEGTFMELMDQLHGQGFEAITPKEFQAFMERNVKIPPRSIFIIQDGNQNTAYYDRYYGEYFVNWGWVVVNGWISEPDISPTLLEENRILETLGFVDHQARGVTPDTILSDETAKSVLARELQGSVNGFAEHFAKTPTVMVWQNGGFGIRPVEVARQLRFKLGFTANARGPVMYNWVPLADNPDPSRPDLLPEGRIGDPLMTLPTYSAQEALLAIDTVRQIGKEAAAYELANKEMEHKYYEIVCEPTYGPMPTP